MSRIPAVALISTIPLTLTLTGCSQPTLPGQMGQLRQVANSCPAGKPVDEDVSIDGTGSSATGAIQSTRAELIKAIAERALLCSGAGSGSGHLTVREFTDSSSDAAVLIDEHMPVQTGATETARLRRASAELQKLDARIDQVLANPPAMSQKGSDIIGGPLRLAAENSASLGPSYIPEVWILTDGEANVSVDLVGAAAAGQDMTVLAQRFDVPNLAGAAVSYVGIAQAAGDPVSSGVANSLVRFYQALCSRTKAASCRVVTTLSPDAAVVGR